MRRFWIAALLLLLAGCGAETAEMPEEIALPGDNAEKADVLYSEPFSGVTVQLRGDPETGTAMTLELLREDGTVSQSFDLSDFGGVMADRGLTEDDLNWDGYPDFYAVKWTAANNWAYACWLWEPETEQYQYSEELSALPSPIFSWRTVTANVHEGAAWNWTSLYQWENGELVMIRSLEPFQESDGAEPGYTYAERLGGTMVTVRRWESWETEQAEIEAYRQKLFYPAENEAVSAGGDRAFLAAAENVPGGEDGTWDLTVTLYDTADLTAPVQVLRETIPWSTDSVHWQDANFDGYPDLSYTTYVTVHNAYEAWWLWDPETERFERSEALSGLGMYPDAEKRQLRQYEDWTLQTYAHRIYAWQDGELVCLWEIKKDRAEDGSMVFTYTVTDDPMGAARVVWQTRCMVGAGEEAELNAELDRYMDYDDKG